MLFSRYPLIRATLAAAFALLTCPALAQHVPLDGYLPMLGFGLTAEFNEDFGFSPEPSSSPAGANFLGPGSSSSSYGTAHYDVALLDTGAGFSLLNPDGYQAFNIAGRYPGESDGFAGTESLPVGGASGQVNALINDPVGIYAGGLQDRAGTATNLVMPHAAVTGQTNVSLVTMPAPTQLPNVIGLPFASQYATRIRNDAPQVFQLNGKTVRTPAIDFLPLGSGGGDINRRAPLDLLPGAGFQSAPTYLPNIVNFDIDNPQENPSTPTLMASSSAGLFIDVDISNGEESLQDRSFFFDTGASVTVVSEENAARLGFDVYLDEPEFTVPVIGSSGSAIDVPGFFVDELEIFVFGGTPVVVPNVPVLVLDVVNVSNPSNIVEGIVGTNVLAGRNLVIDPNPSLGGSGPSPGLYIGDIITTDAHWDTMAATGQWSAAGNWDSNAAPDYLTNATAAAASTGNQEITVVGEQLTGSLTVQGGAAGGQMTVRITPSSKLTAFSGATATEGGAIVLQQATLDVQYVDVRGGTLAGDGLVQTGSGPIPGQVENVGGVVAPGADGVGVLTIDGRYSNRTAGVVQIDIGGLTPGTQHDQLVITEVAALGGTLEVSLADLGAGAFQPSLGDRFEVLQYGGVRDQFQTLSLPVGYQWEAEYGPTGLWLEVTGLGLRGDFNSDGVVDAADYAVLREGMGINYMPSDIQVWLNNYGASLPNPAAPSFPAPSPASFALLAMTIALSCVARRRGRDAVQG